MNISTAAFRKGALLTWSVKPAKAGLRQMVRKNLTANIGHCLVGISTETGELLELAKNYVLGLQTLHDATLQSEMLDELSDLVYYTVLLAKFLKLPLPSATKKQRPGGTPAEALLSLSVVSTHLLSKYKKVYYGQDLDMEKITALTRTLILAVWELSWLLLDKPIAEVMQFNNEKLLTGPNARYPQGTFTTDAIAVKDKADAKKLPLAKTPAVVAKRPRSRRWLPRSRSRPR